MLKSSIIAFALVGSCGATAVAADLPSPAAPLPTFVWTGFHVGINAGGVLGSSSRLSGEYPFLSPVMGPHYRNPGLTNHGGGFVGGVQAGYDHQFRNGLVLGVEADIDMADLDRTSPIASPGMPVGLGANYHTVLDALGTFRGRVGYAFGRTLLYGTGGLALGIGNRRAGLSTSGGSPLSGVNVDVAELGYAVGGGVEYALPISTGSFGGALTARVEYLHYQVGHDARPLSVGATAYDFHVRDSGDLVRAGLNYRF